MQARPLLAGLVWLTWIEVAAAPRVIVLDFEGERASQLRQAVAGVMTDRYEVLGQDEWNHVAKRSGVAPTASQSTVALLAPELRAQAIVMGTVEEKRSRRTLRLTIRDGKDGGLLGARSYSLSSAGLSPAVLANLRGFAVKTAARGRAGEPQLAPEPPPEPTHVVRRTKPIARPAQPRPTAETTTPLSEVRAADEPSVPSQPPDGPLVEAFFGLTLIKRSASFSDSSAHDYSSVPVGGFTLGVEGYPLSRMPGWQRRIGLGLAYGQVFTLTSKYRPTDTTTIELPSRLRQFELLLMYRHYFGRFGAKGLIGYQRISFAIDWNESVAQLPDATYNLFRFGGIGGLSIGARPITPWLGASLLIPTGSSGELDASGGFGFDLQLGVDVPLWRLVSIAPRLRYTRVGVGEADIDGPAPGDTRSDATDQFVHIEASLVARY